MLSITQVRTSGFKTLYTHFRNLKLKIKLEHRNPAQYYVSVRYIFYPYNFMQDLKLIFGTTTVTHTIKEKLKNIVRVSPKI